MSEIIIRPSQPGDEVSIAKVHIQSWQEAYKDILPQDFLDQLTTELQNRTKMWTSIIASSKRWSWVAEGPEGIVGFVLFGPARDEQRDGFIELGAIYLLASQKGKGTGFALLSTGFDHMKELGYDKACCWGLEGNPTIRFYERSGAKFSGKVKVDDIGGQKFNELAYDWESLSFTPVSTRLQGPAAESESLDF